ncbi:peptidoglycan-binding protein [Candidatus Nomurabacteria bacterium]|nr:peptidoglycan-binding protein [Candidatus Nomurabacteria bacterium]
MKTKIFSILFLGAVFFWAGDALANNSNFYTGNVCNFTRDMGPGTWGEDVRCLQQYLSAAVYGGSGYYGMPYQNYLIADGFFGSMTAQAVMQWQRSQSLQASGYFDAASRAKYFELMGGYGGTGGGGFYGINPEEDRARQKIDEALRMMEDARDEIDDSNRNTSDAEDSLEDAEDDMLDAVHEFFVNRDFSEAYDLARDAEDLAQDAIDEVN